MQATSTPNEMLTLLHEHLRDLTPEPGRKIDATLQIAMADAPAMNLYFAANNGAVDVQLGRHAAPTATVTTSLANFLEMVELGLSRASELISSRQIDISGELDAVSPLLSLLLPEKVVAPRHIRNGSEYAFLAPLKEQWRTIRDETLAFFGDARVNTDLFAVPTSAKNSMRSAKSRWKAFSFMNHGKDPEDVMEEYGLPTAIPKADVLRMREKYFKFTTPFLYQFASVPENGIVNMFISYFEPGARLGLHVNNDPYMYRAHLGLSVPEGDVALKVCDETAHWKEGEFLVFTPTDPHTAWNLTNQPRIVLIVDFFKPEEDRDAMVALERAQVAAVMAKDPTSLGMSGGMYDLDAETRRRYSVPHVERLDS